VHDHAAQGFGQGLQLDRFGQEKIHASRKAALAVFRQGVGGDGNDGHAPGRGRATVFFLSTNGAGSGQAIHHGHLQVHQDHVVMTVGPALQALQAVAGHLRMVA
jgi:hypothetical protein